MITRPGPSAVPRLQAPGGVVIHVYGVPTQRLLMTSRCTPEIDVEQWATMDADLCERLLHDDEHAYCIVAYDGDSGERMVWPQ